jgi:hypothetical protein
MFAEDAMRDKATTREFAWLVAARFTGETPSGTVLIASGRRTAGGFQDRM